MCPSKNLTGITYYSRTDTPQHGQKGLPVDVRIMDKAPTRGRRIVTGTVCGRFTIGGRTAGESHTLRCANGPLPVIPGSTHLVLQANGAGAPCAGCGGKNFLMVGEVVMF